MRQVILTAATDSIELAERSSMICFFELKKIKSLVVKALIKVDLLVLLGILAQTRTDVAAEGNDIAKECVCRILGLAGISYTTYFSEYLVIQGSALSCYLLLSQHVVDEDCRHIIGV